jgi:bifunctional UDP-N-acetylglucosamine pyrophosphorylase/glucosamine-1-phosphate N-acetyltransferase
VTLLDPATTYIEPGVVLGPDTVVLPNTHLEGRTTVGAGCVLGPNTIVRDTTIGDRCAIECSVLEGATLAEDVSVGPFAHLRKGARLERGVHMATSARSRTPRSGRASRWATSATSACHHRRRREHRRGHHHLQL